MQLAQDNRDYFDRHGIDVDEWIRQFRQVDQRIRESLRNPEERISQTIHQALQDQVPAMLESLTGVCQPRMDSAVTQLRATLLTDITQLMKTTSNELVNQRLSELNDKLITGFSSITEQSKQLEAGHDKLMAHHLRFDNAKSNADRGNMAEDEYFSIMDRHFATAEIIERRKEQGHSSDFEILQRGRAPVLIELKRYTRTKVEQRAVNRFLDDIRFNQKHGIMVSTGSGVSGKKHFQFDPIDGRFIALYVCNAGTDMKLLETALDIIHCMDTHIKQFTSDEVLRFSPDHIASVCHSLNNHLTRVRDLHKTIQQADKICKDLLSVDTIAKELQR